MAASPGSQPRLCTQGFELLLKERVTVLKSRFV